MAPSLSKVDSTSTTSSEEDKSKGKSPEREPISQHRFVPSELEGLLNDKYSSVEREKREEAEADVKGKIKFFDFYSPEQQKILVLEACGEEVPDNVKDLFDKDAYCQTYIKACKETGSKIDENELPEPEAFNGVNYRVRDDIYAYERDSGYGAGNYDVDDEQVSSTPLNNFLFSNPDAVIAWQKKVAYESREVPQVPPSPAEVQTKSNGAKNRSFSVKKWISKWSFKKSDRTTLPKKEDQQINARQSKLILSPEPTDASSETQSTSVRKPVRRKPVTDNKYYQELINEQRNQIETDFPKLEEQTN